MSAIPGLAPHQENTQCAAVPERHLPLAGLSNPALAMMRTIAGGIAWFLQKVKVQKAHKRLRMCESLPLGDRRFVAVIQVDGERFLIGCSSSSVSMLARLQQSQTFAETFECCQEAGKAS